MGNANVIRPPDRQHGGCLSCQHVRPGSIKDYRGAYLTLMCEKQGFRDETQALHLISKGCWLWEREPGTDDEEPNFPYR